MVFGYYRRLSARQKAVYRRSDEIHAIRLPQPRRLQPQVLELAAALGRQDRVATEAASRRLAAGLTAALGVAPVRVTVLAVRPHDDRGELHGFYAPAHGRRRASLTVWMRTARRRQVVAFRTFLRTLLHELGHHLDYTLLALEDSFHTEGFYRRESSLFHQLVSERRGPEDD